MKIAVISDLHFGYGWGTELENDSFENADMAIQSAIANGADLILLAGDIFDSRFPKTDVLARATKILVKPLLENDRGVNFVSCGNKKLKQISQRTLRHLPIIAIHGTHERRYGVNTVEALENAGILIHLHKETICLEKDGICIAIHGLSGLPERYAKQALEEWKPKPIDRCVNILMLHQSIDPFIYSPLEPAMLKLNDLPIGFDLIVDGHIHTHRIEKANGTPLLFPGSTIITQFEENEANIEKGFYLIDIEKERKLNVKFLKIESRKFFYIKISANGALRERMEKELDAILANNFLKPPIVRIKITGSSSELIEQELKDVERKYSGKVVLRIVKDLKTPELLKKIEFLRNIREQKLSVEELGLELLKENLKELNFGNSFNYEKVFNILVNGNIDNAFNLLMSKDVK